ncbi:porin family protein [Algoriphagus halophytocola]|uniref:Porin family protein n=1 Tax=Algoriphagus halophytocola TaxID=2991499 RepID=A0ABY6MH71_9BACT|nr:porin family protein [Algoriphagus sp. TR-M5]UZD22998.1 porin family protein [Algoriphagus sp. TR-M5]
MKKSIVLIALLAMIFAGTAQAQNSLFSINYAVSIPTGNTSDYIDQASGRGIKLEYQRFLNRNFAIGGELGHYTLYKKETGKVYTEGSASLSGNQYRYQYSYPILVSGAYFPTTEGILKPYAGLGIGTIAHDRRIDMGIFSSEETHWQFALRPELGLLVRPAQYIGFKVGAKYYQSFSGDGLDGQSNVGIDFGIVFIR